MKTRAKIQILSRIISFGTTRVSSEGQSRPVLFSTDYAFNFSEFSSIQVGDLVCISACRDSKWYLSWVVEINPNNGWPEYLLESIEDESLCWWSNISIAYFNRENLAKNPSFRWTDKQFEFQDKCQKSLKRSGSYKAFAGCEFQEDGSVNVMKRRRHHNYEGDFINIKNWKKCTQKELINFFNN